MKVAGDNSPEQTSSFPLKIPIIKQTQVKLILTLTSKQMLPIRLPISLVQVKAGNTYNNLLIEIHKIIFSLYWTNEIIKKYIIQYNEFNTYITQKWMLHLWDLKIVKPLIPHKEILNLSDEISLKRIENK